MAKLGSQKVYEVYHFYFIVIYLALGSDIEASRYKPSKAKECAARIIYPLMIDNY